MHTIKLKRPHSLSEDHILLGERYFSSEIKKRETPKLSDIVQIPVNHYRQVANPFENNDSTKPSRKPSFRIHDETQEKLFRFEKFRKDSESISFEQGRKRFMSFNLF